MKAYQLSEADSHRVVLRSMWSTTVALLVLTLLFVAAASRSLSQETTPEQRRAMAHKIITESARIKPHELVVIQGNSVFAPLMEDLAVEASKAGGFAVLMPTSDSFIRSVLTEVPDEYLGQPDPTLDWIKNVAVFINLPGIYDEPKVMADVPAAKQVKLSSANQNEYMSAFRSSKARSLYIDAPVPGQAGLYGFEVPSYTAIQWEAIGTGESNIQQDGKNISNALKTAKSVHLTAPDGTDVTFKLGSQTPFISGGVTHPEAAKWEDRNATLPAGNFAAAVAPGTFEGTINTPEDYCPGLVKLKGVSYQFSAGKMTSFKAQENEKCLRDYFGAYSGSKDVVASVQIGLNPALKTQSKIAPANTAGMIWVSLGRDDRFGATGTSLNWSIPVSNATLSADGKNIVENGRLNVQ